MNFIYSAASLVLVLLQTNTPVIFSTEIGGDGVLNPNIATEGFPREFLQAEYRDGVTYLETCVVDQTTKMHAGDQDLGDSTMVMVAESEIAVSAIEGGGKKVEISYDHVGMTMKMLGQTQKYDSDQPDEDSPLHALLDHSITLVIDDDGTVASASENEELLKSLTDTTGGGSPATDLASSKRFEQATRITKTLPEDPVLPGEEWDFEYSEDDMVQFKGASKLLGYANHNGHFCAVVAMSGDIDFNMGELAEILGEDENEEGDGAIDFVAEAMQNIQVRDGRMEATLYFDNEAKFMRWMEMSVTMTMSVPMGDDEMLMNIESVTKVSTRIKGE
mmetsp:Transcript_18411/g.25331  ORF Transcript_18411/g.25331 Transcript_18411/m.25331 type:complete len:332 (-) Transcript_18411:208-1203(-)|eukprot:CAMPEP_0185723798 /NCGR_PEP_ID=MMETSP1171-20130828/514_1 /TAXON_ID=374046 /ORGANISM="Helicotheca tamensis, Strain CCMP826" /LENGTH=331 /DNA_ID=CAMNT_0028391551 /DNA_START=66 /DNA_END=1061 /DNA_ORIENTATION=-